MGISFVRNKYRVLYRVLYVLFLIIGCASDDYRVIEPPPTPQFPSIDRCPGWFSNDHNFIYCHRGVEKIFEDGSYISNPDSMGLWIYQCESDTSRLLLSGNILYVDIAPDDEWIVYNNNAQIFKARFSNDTIVQSTVEQLTYTGHNWNPTWSPDGAWIVYGSNNCETLDMSATSSSCGIYKMRSDGTGNTFIVAGKDPCWSPDGMYLIYIGLYSEVYRIDLDNLADIEQLTTLNPDGNNYQDNLFPRYSPDGEMISFVSAIGQDVVKVMNSDGTELRTLVSGNWPSWAMGGQGILFTHSPPDNSNDTDTVWSINIDATGLIQYTYGPR